MYMNQQIEARQIELQIAHREQLTADKFYKG
jgi:hypothetical protein